MQANEQAALERLIDIADGNSGQSSYVADFLLAWWNAEECGGFDLTKLWALDTGIAADVVTVTGLISRLHQYPDTLGYKPRFDQLIRAWRKPATLNRYKATFSSVYRFGKQRSKVNVNPVRDVSQQPVNNGVIRFLKPDEEIRLRAVLQKAVDACGPQNERRRKRLMHRIYELDVALGTGMRKGEQYGLRWRDVDLKTRVITLRDTKNKTSRTIPMIDDVLRAFTALRELSLERKDRAVDRPNSAPEDVVFGIGDNKKWWESALKEAKIKNLRWHDLRHTFCSRLAQAGVSLKVIQEAAGHKTIAMSARYAHMDHTTLHNAMSVLNRPNPGQDESKED